jgi:hypothetical protein
MNNRGIFHAQPLPAPTFSGSFAASALDKRLPPDRRSARYFVDN